MAIPMKIVDIDGYSARFEVRGTRRGVNIFMPVQSEELSSEDTELIRETIDRALEIERSLVSHA
jgi:hypothetical protein